MAPGQDPHDMGISPAALIVLCIFAGGTIVVCFSALHRCFLPLRWAAGGRQRQHSHWPSEAQLVYMSEVHTRQYHAAYRNFAWELAEDKESQLRQSRYYREWLERSRLFRPFDAAREWIPPHSWDERRGDGPLSYIPIRIVGQSHKGKEPVGAAPPDSTTTAPENEAGSDVDPSSNEFRRQTYGSFSDETASYQTLSGSHRPPSPVLSTFMGQTPRPSPSHVRGNSTLGSNSMTTPGSTNPTTVTPSSSTGTFEVKGTYIPRDVRLTYRMAPQPIVVLPPESSIRPSRDVPAGLGISTHLSEASLPYSHYCHGELDIEALQVRQRAREWTLFGSTV